MRHPLFPAGLTRRELVDWFLEGRRRSEALFSIASPDAYYDRPIALRHPIVFYQGHLPAFTINTLVKLGSGSAGIDESYEVLFARGIDPESEKAVPASALWPSRSDVETYARQADARIVDILESGELERSDRPALHRGEAVFTILEHEAMHHETFLYMLHNLPRDRKKAREPFHGNPPPPARIRNASEANEFVPIDGGIATLGNASREVFGWDNEFGEIAVTVEPFSIQRYNVTNGEFLEFVEAGGYDDDALWKGSEEIDAIRRQRHPHFWSNEDSQWQWRGMFTSLPLPRDWPVYVTHVEAEAYARWIGARLPTEAEYHRAAFDTPEGDERPFPWGDELPDHSRGNFDFQNWDPVPVGSYPAGASAWGVHDLVGNGWEWTSTEFGPLRGFRPMASYPEYSADFFDAQHYVMKGASPVTARELVRRSFRNWFRPAYPYVYATFRCVR